MDFCLKFVISNDELLTNVIDKWEIVKPPKSHESQRVFGLRFRLVFFFFVFRHTGAEEGIVKCGIVDTATRRVCEQHFGTCASCRESKLHFGNVYRVVFVFVTRRHSANEIYENEIYEKSHLCNRAQFICIQSNRLAFFNKFTPPSRRVWHFVSSLRAYITRNT